MEKQVVYTFPGSADTVTLTIGTASALDYAKYETEHWKSNNWFKGRNGVNTWEMPEEKDRTPEQQADMDMMDVLIHRGYMLAVVKAISWSGEPVLDLDHLPLEAFANELPAGLYGRWKRAAQEVNPGVFWFDQSEAGN
jgi:hypothetical protein